MAIAFSGTMSQWTRGNRPVARPEDGISAHRRGVRELLTGVYKIARS